jgi:hypothetical protein
MKRSGLFKIGWRELLHGIVLAVIAAIITSIVSELQAGTPIDKTLLKKAGIAALIAMGSYLLKELASNADGDLLSPDK